VTGRHAVHQPHGHNSHHPQIATKHKDAAQFKGTGHWRACAKRVTVRLQLKAQAQLKPDASGKPHTLQRFCPPLPGAIHASKWWRCQSTARQKTDRIASELTLHGQPTLVQVVLPSRAHQAPSLNGSTQTLPQAWLEWKVRAGRVRAVAILAPRPLSCLTVAAPSGAATAVKHLCT
jgi:hypothetical protein